MRKNEKATTPLSRRRRPTSPPTTTAADLTAATITTATTTATVTNQVQYEQSHTPLHSDPTLYYHVPLTDSSGRQEDLESALMAGLGNFHADTGYPKGPSTVFTIGTC